MANAMSDPAAWDDDLLQLLEEVQATSTEPEALLPVVVSTANHFTHDCAAPTLTVAPSPPPTRPADPSIDACAKETAHEGVPEGDASMTDLATVKRPTPKQEMARLRDQVTRLTMQLNALKLASGLDLDTPILRQTATIPMTPRNDPATIGLWRRLACKQRKHREHAERDNRLLREAVAVRARRAKRLRQLIKKQTDEEMEAIAPLLGNSDEDALLKLRHDKEFFAELSQGMNEMYTDTDAVLQRVGMAEVPRPGHLFGLRTVDSHRWNADFRHVRVFPFHWEQTDRVVWSACTDNATASNEHETRSDFSFANVHPVFGACSVRVRSFMTRTCEKERSVMLQRAVVEAVGYFVIHVSTWIVVKQGPQSTVNPTSVLEGYLTGSGVASPTISDMIPDSGALMDMKSVDLWNHGISATLDAIEDRLMQEAFQPEVQHRSDCVQ